MSQSTREHDRPFPVHIVGILFDKSERLGFAKDSYVLGPTCRPCGPVHISEQVFFGQFAHQYQPANGW